jgi:membrane protease YdiL (CAAX protease family)
VSPRDSRLSPFQSNSKTNKRCLVTIFPLVTLSLVQNDEFIAPLDPIASGEPAQIVPASPNNPPWGPLQGLGLWLASVAFIIISPAIFLLPYLAMQRGSILDSQELIEFAKTDPTAVFLQIVAVLPAHLLTVLIAWLVVTQGRKYGFREMLGWQSGGFRWWYYIVVLVAFFALAIVVSKFVPEQENDLIRMLQTSRSAVYIIAFVATFTAPFVEEVVYRGVLFSAFQKRIGTAGGFLFATLLFAAVHVPQYWPSYSTLFLLLFLSVILTGIRVWSKNLWPCIVLHTLFNATQSLSLIFAPDQAPKTDLPEPVTAILRLFHLG